MKKLHLLKTVLLLFALVVGSSSVWAAAGDPQWSYTVVNGDASKLNTTAKTFTVDATHVFSYEGTTIAAGTPTVATGTASSTFGLKFGSSGSNYFSPVILSTSAFSDKSVKKVRLYLKHNGGKVGTLTVKQGDVTIGTAKTASTSNWINVVCSETESGEGGNLEIKYEVAQALYINKIEVWYDDISSDTWSVTYDANGATSGDVPTDDTEYDAENKSVTVKGNTGSLAKTGYTFNGWNTKADGSGTGYAAGASFEISSNTTLYAQWTVNSHSVTLPTADAYGSYSMSVSNPVSYGTAVTLTYTPAAGYEEYRASWSVNGSPIVGDAFNMPDADVTVTVSVEEVKDYATLPFAFDGGVSDIEDTEGLTQDGLGSDYGSSPKLKFDHTGDYVILKINEAPGILTFDIKGNSFSGGTFKVQASADGESYSDVASYTSLSDTQTKEINNLASTVRYIKWIYTKKSSGNVALGNISLAKVRPIITLSTTSVEATTEETPGTIEVTYMNFSDIVADVEFYESDGVTLATYDWLNAEINASNNVAYTIAANTGEARTAYMKVYALDDNSEEVYSDLITFTQEKYYVPTHRLVTSIVPGRHYVFASGTDGEIKTMGSMKSTNRNAVSETAHNGQLSLDNETETYEFVIGFDAESGYYTIHDNSVASTGYLYAAGGSGSNHLKVQAENDENGQWSITFDGNSVATIKANMSGRNWMRYNSGSSCYSCYSSGQNNIYLYERIGDTGSQDFTVNIASACTDGDKYYGTFSAPFAFTAPDGVTVAEIGLDNENKLNVQAYGAGDVVPANTGVMISSTSAGAKTFTSAEGGSSVLGSNNRLRPTNYGITAANMSDADDDCQFYRLTMHEGTQIGFWWGAAEGAAFDIAANKAYLAVPSGVAARSFWFDEGETTAISAALMNNERMNNEVYNLNGQRVTQPTKGLYIVNGRKVVIK